MQTTTTRIIFRANNGLRIAPQERAHRDAMQIRFADYRPVIASDRRPTPNLRLCSPNVLGPKQPWYGAAWPNGQTPKRNPFQTIARSRVSKYNPDPARRFALRFERSAALVARRLRASQLPPSELLWSPLAWWSSLSLSSPAAAFRQHSQSIQTAPAPASKCVFS